ncbi:MAG: branched-chain amino acid transaminase [Alphaproteobacteria bacterium]|nr:branched-chain amino acid transaminase [Alphaproteobacteria bacterium]
MSMSNRDGFIWFDGALIPWREANVHVLTHTLHYSVGVFEGIRAYETDKGTAIFRLQEHTDRLLNSAKIMRLNAPYDKDTINAACRTAVTSNKLASAYIRPIVFLGSEGMGIRAESLKVHVAIAAWHWGSYLGDEGITKGIRVKTSSLTRHHVNITMCKAKATSNYANSVLALREAVEAGADEAMLLDAEGYVAEGSGENIFIVRNGVIYTPEPSSALEGITRDTVIQLAQENGYQIKEKRITRDEVYIADEVFFTGTAAEVTPIREVDGRPIGNGARGPITEKLQSLYFDVVKGKSATHNKWLTYTT